MKQHQPRGRITSDGNRVAVLRHFGLSEFRRLLAAIHNLTHRQGYDNIQISFADCDATFPGPMAALCAEACRLRLAGVSIELVLPTNIRLRNLFMNAGWAYLLDPERYDESRFRGYSHVPAIQFSSPSEQQSVLNGILDTILRSTEGLAREDLAAIEWAINEVTDNVLVHAQSEAGGIVHLNNYKAKKRVELVVADAGTGICRTLRQGRPEIESDTRALERAIREGVTRDKALGQGNGLFGTFRIAEQSRGYFHIHANLAQLAFDGEELHIRSDAIPHSGSLVVVGMNYANARVLGEALSLDGYQPTDYIQTTYELDAAPDIHFEMRVESSSFGSRVAGEPIRRKLLNLHEMSPGKRISIDFSEVPVISSSFADEVFGKLFVAIGPISFMRRFIFVNINGTVQSLIDRAIVQRSSPD